MVRVLNIDYFFSDEADSNKVWTRKIIKSELSQLIIENKHWIDDIIKDKKWNWIWIKTPHVYKENNLDLHIQTQGYDIFTIEKLDKIRYFSEMNEVNQEFITKMVYEWKNINDILKMIIKLQQEFWNDLSLRLEEEIVDFIDWDKTVELRN